MKRSLFLFAILAMAVAVPQSVKAQNYDFSYTHQGTTLYYIIDSTSAFEGCLRMETVTIPSVNAIGYSAFYHCNALQAVALPEACSCCRQATTSPPSCQQNWQQRFWGQRLVRKKNKNVIFLIKNMPKCDFFKKNTLKI